MFAVLGSGLKDTRLDHSAFLWDGVLGDPFSLYVSIVTFDWLAEE